MTRCKAIVVAGAAGVLAIVSGGMSGVAPASGQDAGSRSDAERSAQDQPPIGREVIERRLAQLEQQQRRLREVLQRIDAGESLQDIADELRERGELARYMGDLRGVFREGVDGDRSRVARRLEDRRRRGAALDVPDDPILVRNRVLAFADRHMPELAERLRREADSPEARRAVARLWQRVAELEDLEGRDATEFRPKLEQLRNGLRISELLQAVRRKHRGGELTSDDVRKARVELTELVSAQFDAQMREREAFMGRMAQRLATGRQTLEQERAQKTQRIEREVDAMLRRAREGDGPLEPRAGRPGGRG
ncbi:MAG: hypothetical protein AAFX79_07355 [Planctomycetota bacterium]